MRKLAQTLLLSLAFSASAIADVLTLREDAPTQYVVKKGDTLWDISALFLNTPWKWPELWGHNPQIENPHLIYPGDILRLVYTDDGQPRLVVANAETNNVVKVSPTKRTTIKRYQPVETLPLSEITSYLNYERILVAGEYDDAPMVLGGSTSTKRKVKGDIIYSQGDLEANVMYGIYNKIREFGEKGSQIYELELAGTTRVSKSADENGVVTLKVLSNKRDIAQGFKLFPLLDDQSLPANYTLSIPEQEINARILGASSRVTEFTKLEVVIIDAGKEHGLSTGNVLGIYNDSPVVYMQKGKPVYKEDASRYTKIIDSFREDSAKNELKMPTENTGEMVLFKVYDTVSYGIIMDANAAIRVNDVVKLPE